MALRRRSLDCLFNPRSVALIGASDRAQSVGATVMRNLIAGGFTHPIWPVNLRSAQVARLPAYRTVAELPGTPDLAVLCTPAPTVPGLIAELGQRGTRAAVVISAGLEQATPSGETLGATMLEAARRYSMRILGPNCIGLLVPRIGLNASFAHCDARRGDVAFVAQSGALTTAMLDWAQSAQVGFSHFVSLGNAWDVDFGDVLDYLAYDFGTRAILLYVESITRARKFMSAARAAARNKPVIVVKSGRTGEAARAAHTHSGALAGSDAVYEAAFRRAGILRVASTRQLFDAAEILACLKPYVGPRLGILGNAGGPGVMATDALIAGGGELATIGPETLLKLDALLPASWSRGDPIDIGGDARPARYVEALEVVLAEPAIDALLVIHAPTALASAAEVAAACAPQLSASQRPVIACFMGGAPAMALAPQVPTYATPEEAIDGFLHVVRYHRTQALLDEAPAAVSPTGAPDVVRARAVIGAALAERRTVLTEPEAKDVLAAYEIPVVATRIVRQVGELSATAAAIGYPVALKVLSPQISHKSDVGGVALNLATAAELEQSAESMLARCRQLRPDARIEGFTVQQMIRRGGAHELLAGVSLDPTFGPTIVFGAGGTAVEVLADRALALPPLNAVLARDLVSQTRVERLLRGYRDRPAVDLRALEDTLIKLAQLACDLPEIQELDINPLLADEQGVIALDARVRVAASHDASATDRLAIRPRPVDLDQRTSFRGRSLLLRPIRAEDFAQHQRFLTAVTPEDMHTRFFTTRRELSASELAHLTQIDYDREMAFVAVAVGEGGVEETLGVARVYIDIDNTEAEFALLVRSDQKGHGLGRILLETAIDYCRARGTQRIVGQVLVENVAMLSLARRLKFKAGPPLDGVLEVALDLRGQATSAVAM